MSSVIKISKTNHSSGLRVQTFNVDPGKDFESEEGYWSRKIENARQQAFTEGRESALHELENRFGNDLLAKYGEFANIILALETQFGEYEKSFEQIVTRLSFDIAEKIIRKKIDTDPIIAETVSEAAQKILGADKLLIRINPADYELLKESGRGLFHDDSFSQVKFDADTSIEKGGCVIESDIGNVDARINTQLNELKNKFNQNYLTGRTE